jgi:hypothetical protein
MLKLILYYIILYICKKNNIMEIGTKHKFKDGSIGTLIQKNKNFGLFKFENGSQFVFNLNKL